MLELKRSSPFLPARVSGADNAEVLRVSASAKQPARDRGRIQQSLGSGDPNPRSGYTLALLALALLHLRPKFQGSR